jgi:hypothetical protein
MLNNIKFIFLIIDNKKNLVSKHYSKIYNTKYKCLEYLKLILILNILNIYTIYYMLIKIIIYY